MTDSYAFLCGLLFQIVPNVPRLEQLPELEQAAARITHELVDRARQGTAFAPEGSKSIKQLRDEHSEVLEKITQLWGTNVGLREAAKEPVEEWAARIDCLLTSYGLRPGERRDQIEAAIKEAYT